MSHPTLRIAFALLCGAGLALAQDSAWSRLEEGRKHLERDETDRARACFESALRHDAGCTTACYYLGRIAEDEGDRAAAREHYARVRKQDPVYPLACERLGQLAQRVGDRETALGHYRDAAVARPTGPAWMRVARLEIELKRFDDAGKTLDRAAEFSGEDPQLAGLRGRLLLETRRFDKAEKVFAGLVRRFPRDPHFGFSLGLCHLEQGDTAEAVETFRKVLEVDPYHRASLQILVGLWDDDPGRAEAVAELRRRLRALDRNPPRVHDERR